jgi:hypothetical protein
VLANIATAATRSVDGFILNLKINDFSICSIKRGMYVLLSVAWLTVGFEVFLFLEFERVGSEP